jgi:hypothetical protein
MAVFAPLLPGGCGEPEGNGADTPAQELTDPEGGLETPPDAPDAPDEVEGCPGVECEGACCGQGESCVGGRCACESGVRCTVDTVAVCCGDGMVCYLGECIVPGDACADNEDCGDGEYCETLIDRCLPSAGTSDCRYQPPAEDFRPEVMWSWPRDDTPHPEIRAIISTPLVVPHPDFGPLDPAEPPMPAVIFLAGSRIDNPQLRAVSGLDGTDLFYNETDVFEGQSQIAVGDLDGRGTWEIVGLLAGSSPPRCSYGGSHNNAHLAAFDAHGRRLWVSDEPVSYGTAAPCIANIDGDNTAEIIVGRSVFNHDGTLRWTAPAGGMGWDACTQAGAYSIVADVTGDTVPEIVAGNTAYRADGTVLWTAPVRDGSNAAADFDLDGVPEIVVVHGSPSGVHILTADGETRCHYDPGLGGATIGGGPPVVADFNADTLPEIGVVWPNLLDVVSGSCERLWRVATTDASGQTAMSVFDFNGDGAAEVVYMDETAVRIFSGQDGEVILTLPHSSATGIENPVVADVNNDGHTEILAVGQQTAEPSMKLFGDENRNWVASRPVWNQHAYHVTNVSDVGDIPGVEASNWTQPGLNNYRTNSAGDRMLDVPDLRLVDLEALGGECTDALILTVRVINMGARGVPAGQQVLFTITLPDGTEEEAGPALTSAVILPGESEEVRLRWEIPEGLEYAVFLVRAVVDPDSGTGFGETRECDEDNNEAGPIEAGCAFFL